MSLYKTLIILFTIISTTSCSQDLKDIETSKEYQNILQNKDLESIKNQIKNDTVFLNKLLKVCDFDMQYTFHFSSGEKNPVKSSVPNFQIDTDLPKITELFNQFAPNSNFEQNFQKNSETRKIKIFENKNFEFENNLKYIIPNYDSIYKNIISNTNYKIQKYYYNGKPIALNQIGLKRIDSLEVTINTEIPLAFEKIHLTKNKNNLYKNYNIEIVSLKENSAELKIPIQLYHKIIGYQATNKSNFLMNTSAMSSASILEIDASIQSNIVKLNDILLKILNEADENKAKKLLNTITQSMFDAKNKLNKFQSEVESFSKTKPKDEFGVKTYEKVAEIGKEVLSIVNQSVMIEFPDNISSIDLYVQTDSKILEKTPIVHYKKDQFIDPINPTIVFSSFEEGKGISYGISDKDGAVLLEKISDDKPEQAGNDYFYINQKLHYFDQQSKELLQLSDYSRYIGQIKKGYDILEKEKTIKGEKQYMEGVVKNSKETVLPFIYSGFVMYSKFFVATKDYFEKVELFDYNFNKIPNNEIVRIHKIDYHISTPLIFPEIFEAENLQRKKALLDANLKPLTPYKYEFINPFFDINNYFIVGIRTEDNSNYYYGLINEKGVEVTTLMFDNIQDQFKNGKINFRIKNSDKFQTLDLETFLNKYRK
ncbi:hypothetical protein AAIP55_002303 [Flavobacterium psychrophilum]|nr:hypothetical protein [Flavobacterium psychrophilum]EKT4518090.1 hypothetical protein [Flavobacterium psychrophilum]